MSQLVNHGDETNANAVVNVTEACAEELHEAQKPANEDPAARDDLVVLRHTEPEHALDTLFAQLLGSQDELDQKIETRIGGGRGLDSTS